jgi:hypothetical protein
MVPSSYRRLPRPSTVILAGRCLGAGLLVAMAVIHLVLWFDGYREITLIGPAFLANATGGAILALAVLAVSRRRLPVVAAVAALFLAGTLAALLLSATVGLFGFLDTIDTPLARASLVVEGLGIVVCVATGLLAASHREPRLRRDPGSDLWIGRSR